MKNIQSNSIVYSLLRMTILSTVIFFTVSLLSVFLVWISPASESLLQVCLLLSLSASSFFAAFYCSVKRKKQGLLNGFAAGLILTAIFVFVLSNATGSSIESLTYLKLLIPLAAGIIGGILGVN